MLIHEIRSGVRGKNLECQDDMDNNNILMDNIKELMPRNNLNWQKLNKVLKHDVCGMLRKRLKYNLVDKIV